MASNSKRERELARMRAERQAARREAAHADKMKRRNALLAGLAALAVAAVIIVIAVNTDHGSSNSTLAQATPSTSATPGGPCSYTTSGTASRHLTGLPDSAGTNTKKTVDLKTNRGTIELSLDGTKAPCTVGSFAFLAGQKYFDSTKCHRLTSSGIYVLQCGDPSATGTGGPGYQFADENLTALGTPGASGTVIYPRGTIAMANSGPGTNGSQFFLVYKDSPLQPAYTPFGTITKGLAILDAVAKAGSTPVSDGKPNLPVTIQQANVKAS